MENEIKDEILEKLSAVCLTDDVKEFLDRQQPADIMYHICFAETMKKV